MGGHTNIEFCSGDAVHKMGTFCLQIPSQITGLAPGNSFEIPDDFMQKELGLTGSVNPVIWYDENDKIAWAITDTSLQAEAVNELFGKFMDAVAKFCNYDRRRIMKEHQDWANQFTM